jgi:hypothetical protein
MEDKDIVNIDTPNDTEEVVPVETTEGESAEDKAARLEEMNKKLFERAKKAEELAKTLKANKSITNPEKPDSTKEFDSRMSKLELSEKKRQFGYRNGLSPEETDRLFKFAGDEDPHIALKDDFFQAGLSAFRNKQKVNNAIPSSSNRNRAVVEGKTFADMSAEERKKNWGKITGVK